MAKKKGAAKVECLGPTYEAGMPEDTVNWRSKFTNRDLMMKYLETGERYFFAKEEVFGSEKRKKPA